MITNVLGENIQLRVDLDDGDFGEATFEPNNTHINISAELDPNSLDFKSTLFHEKLEMAAMITGIGDLVEPKHLECIIRLAELVYREEISANCNISNVVPIVD